MLARAHRITRGADYRSVVRRGRRCVAAHLMSYTTVSVDAGPSRFGFIVSKQVGSAVTRNTVRRRLKAISAGPLLLVSEATVRENCMAIKQ